MVENELDRTPSQIKGLIDALYADFTGPVSYTHLRAHET